MVHLISEPKYSETFSFNKDKLRWCLFFYLILNRTLMLNSVKY